MLLRHQAFLLYFVCYAAFYLLFILTSLEWVNWVGGLLSILFLLLCLWSVYKDRTVSILNRSKWISKGLNLYAIFLFIYGTLAAFTLVSLSGLVLLNGMALLWFAADFYYCCRSHVRSKVQALLHSVILIVFVMGALFSLPIPNTYALDVASPLNFNGMTVMVSYWLLI